MAHLESMLHISCFGIEARHAAMARLVNTTASANNEALGIQKTHIVNKMVIKIQWL